MNPRWLPLVVFAAIPIATTIATALRYGGIGDPQLLQALQFTQRQLGPVEREVMRFDRHALPGRLYAHCFCSAH